MVEQWITWKAADKIYQIPRSTLRRIVRLSGVRVKRGPNAKSTQHIAKADLDKVLAMPDGYMVLKEAAHVCGYNQQYLQTLVREGRIETRRKGRLLMVKLDSLKAYATRSETSLRYKRIPFIKWLQASGFLEMKPIPRYPVIQKAAAEAGIVVSYMVISSALRDLNVRLFDVRPSGTARAWALKNYSRFVGWEPCEIWRFCLEEIDMDISQRSFQRVWRQVRKIMQKEFQDDARNA